jgi:hypothetical protein
MIRKFSTALEEVQWVSSVGRSPGLRAGQIGVRFGKVVDISFRLCIRSDFGVRAAFHALRMLASFVRW